MSRKLWPLAALALIALIGAGCGGNGSSGGGNTTAANQEKAVKFAQCMRENGVSEFPDPDASGRLTIDGVLNGSSIDPNGPDGRGPSTRARTCSRRGSRAAESGAPISRTPPSSSPSASARTACRTFRIPPLVSPSSTRIESHPPTRQVV